eukprot:SAG25_NODE_645_length_6217_cov_5.064237_1_plen_113_part_00
MRPASTPLRGQRSQRSQRWSASSRTAVVRQKPSPHLTRHTPAMDLSVLQLLQTHGMQDGGRGWEALGATSQLSVTLAAVNSELRQRRHNELQKQACYAGTAAVLDQIRENVA